MRRFAKITTIGLVGLAATIGTASVVHADVVSAATVGSNVIASGDSTTVSVSWELTDPVPPEPLVAIELVPVGSPTGSATLALDSASIELTNCGNESPTRLLCGWVTPALGETATLDATINTSPGTEGNWTVVFEATNDATSPSFYATDQDELIAVGSPEVTGGLTVGATSLVSGDSTSVTADLTLTNPAPPNPLVSLEVVPVGTPAGSATLTLDSASVQLANCASASPTQIICGWSTPTAGETATLAATVSTTGDANGSWTLALTAANEPSTSFYEVEAPTTVVVAPTPPTTAPPTTAPPTTAPPTTAPPATAPPTSGPSATTAPPTSTAPGGTLPATGPSDAMTIGMVVIASLLVAAGSALVFVRRRPA